jgi:hypothetical protein
MLGYDTIKNLRYKSSLIYVLWTRYANVSNPTYNLIASITTIDALQTLASIFIYNLEY